MEQHNHYTANPSRYDQPNIYNRCGRSGVLLPKVSLGMWHNFSSGDPFERSRAITRYAFDHGITHFDLANNYGPPPGTAEHPACSRRMSWIGNPITARKWSSNSERFVV